MDTPLLNDYLVVTGGSQGTEQAAENLARDYGIPVAIKIGPSHPRSSQITPLTREELNDACEPMGNAAHALTRPIPPSPIACELLLRYYYVVNNANTVFVFGYLSSSQKQVQGNTGFAVQAAIELQKRIFLYDVNFHQWYEWHPRRHLYTALPTLTIAAHATILAMMNHSFMAHAAQLPRIGFHPVTTIALPEWTDQQAREDGHFTTFQFAMHVQHSTREGLVTDTCLPIRASSIRVLCLFLLSFPINTSHASLVRHSHRSRTWHEVCWLLLFIHSLIESSSQTPSRRGLKPGGIPPHPPLLYPPPRAWTRVFLPSI